MKWKIVEHIENLTVNLTVIRECGTKNAIVAFVKPTNLLREDLNAIVFHHNKAIDGATEKGIAQGKSTMRHW